MLTEISNDFDDVIQEKFCIYSFNGAYELLKSLHPIEFNELVSSLSNFSAVMDDLREPGGNKSPIPPKFESYLYNYGWEELRITADLVIHYATRTKPRSKKYKSLPSRDHTVFDYIDGHFIDFVKNNVALDIEWNGKDQTFDRDLMAFRAFYEAGIISCGVIITRDISLNEIFNQMTYQKTSRKGIVQDEKLIKKYGASTTWIGKLLPRLQAHRAGGCPVLAIGIKKGAIIDWPQQVFERK